MNRAIAITLLLWGCSAAPQPEDLSIPETAAQRDGYIAYGGSGFLTDAQVATLRGLGWPQSIADMKGTFGVPNQRTATADIYIAPDGRKLTVTIEGDLATGFQE